MTRWNARPQNSRTNSGIDLWTGGPRKNGVRLQKAEPPKTTGRPRTGEEEIEAEDYRDGKPFAAYCIIVASVLSDVPMTIRAINAALGDRRRGHWTMDALARVANVHTECVSIYRYTRKGDFNAA